METFIVQFNADVEREEVLCPCDVRNITLNQTNGEQFLHFLTAVIKFS